MSALSKSSLVPEGYVIGAYIAERLGLPNNYFTEAHRQGIELHNVEVIKLNEKYIHVKLDEDIAQKLSEGYICNKITKDEIEDYDIVFRLSRTCIIGMYK